MPQDVIAGPRAVEEALRAGHEVSRLLLARDTGDARAAALELLARERGIPVEHVAKGELDALYAGKHQGVVALSQEAAYAEVADCLRLAAARKEDVLLVALDQVEDPGNVGAILRSAEAAGVHGVILTERGGAGLTAGVHKASAGASLRVPVARAANLAQTLRELKEKGVWIGGADLGAPKTLWETKVTGPFCLVVGSEGEGMRRLTRDLCDFTFTIPMRGKLASLNVSAAAAIVLFERVRQVGAARGPAGEQAQA